MQVIRPDIKQTIYSTVQLVVDGGEKKKSFQGGNMNQNMHG
jgi:hypothetical protein